MTDVIFRRAQLADLPAIIALLADDILGQQREMYNATLHQNYVEAFQAIDTDPNQLLVVAESEKTIVGTLQLSFIPGLGRKGAWRGQIEAVRIASACRGRGWGEHMINWAIEQCKARNCHFVQLTTDNVRTDAHRFYEKLGFLASHKGYKLSL